MDESLTDFKEPKKLAGLKNTKKIKADKPKKAPKRIRGQKDIRTSLQSKKSELQSYSKDFDYVCKQAGLDVDSDQLHLAIALSKSLQESNHNDYPETSQSLSSQERVKKIRSTLLEYGFKVPNIKITTASRRLKKKKYYKLLLTSEDVKQQIIVDKYSQVLFENITPSISQNSDVDVTHIQLYNLATNASYSKLRSIDNFYVDGLLEKSTSTGNLLRDWSKIPGRPLSPMLCKPTIMNFSEIECSQDELDIVLSGSLKSCKNVIKCKQKEASVCVQKISEQNKLVSINNSVIVLLDDESSKSNDADDILKNKELEIMDPEKLNPVNKTLTTNGSPTIDTDENIAIVNECRSCSPDLFDDEPSIVIDNTTNIFSQESESSLHLKSSIIVSSSNNVMDLTECDQNINMKQKHSIYPNSQQSQNTNVTRRFNDFMETTECVEVQCPITNSTKNSEFKLSQNVTKRKSNDFMEITNCVVRPVQPLLIEENVDLTQSLVIRKKSDVSGANGIVKHKLIVDTSNESTNQNIVEAYHIHFDVNRKNKIENIELGSEETPEVIFISKENHIDLTENPELVKKYNVEDNMADETIESMDLTQSSNTSDELPFISLKTDKKGQSSDDTIIMDSKNYEIIVKSVVLQNNDQILDLTKNIMHEKINCGSQESQYSKIHCTENEQIPRDILDLTHGVVTTSRNNSKTSDTNISFFDDYVHNHSDENDMHKELTCNSHFYKGFDHKEILCLDVNRDPSSKTIESPDLVVSQCLNLISITNPNKSDDIDLTQNSESSEELQYSQNNGHSKSKDDIINSKDVNEKRINIKISNGCQVSHIDLTQYSEPNQLAQDIRNNDSIQNFSLNDEIESESACTNEIDIVKSSQRCSSLGKKGNVSIDYDDLVYQYSHSQQSQSSSKSAADNNVSNASNKSMNISNCSQASEGFVISDHELDYSMHQSKLEKPVDNFILGGISIMDELSGLASFRRSTNIENNLATASNSIALAAENSERDIDSNHIIEVKRSKKTPVKHKRVGELATPQKSSCSGINTVVTPSKSQYVIKTIDVTPMPKYEMMSLHELHIELDSFGVKPFERKRAIQLLTHIYNQTHPTVESDDESPCKRRKTNDYESPRKPSPRKLTPRKILSPKKIAKSPRKVAKKMRENLKEKVSEESNTRLNNREVIQIVSENYVVNETPVIKEVECNPDDWVFQKREKAKVHTCRVPLHIAFYNYVSSRRELREAILCYEPINIDDIHKDLVAYGHRYDPKELLKFMDKKCITVKTTDNDARNQKR